MPFQIEEKIYQKKDSSLCCDNKSELSFIDNYKRYIPKLPEIFNKDYFYQEQTLNLYNLTCSCSDYKNRKLIFEDAEVRCICKHLFWVLTNTAVNQYLDNLTKQILFNTTFYKDDHLYKSTIDKKDIIFSFSSTREENLINVYYDFYNGGVVALIYDYKIKRWTRGESFIKQEEVERLIENLVEFSIQKIRDAVLLKG